MFQETSGESDWAGVELEEFMQCEHNMAVNRQTRMLADLGIANFFLFFIFLYEIYSEQNDKKSIRWKDLLSASV
jgi:hypothetical protein